MDTYDETGGESGWVIAGLEKRIALLTEERQQLKAENDKLRKACQRAFDFVSDEDNNKVIVTMPFSFGLYYDLAEALEDKNGN